MSEWIEWKWTEEKPYPETLETRVFICLDGLELGIQPFDDFVENWWWEPEDGITHYRIAE